MQFINNRSNCALVMGRGESSTGLTTALMFASNIMPRPMGSACGLFDMTPEFVAHGGEQLVAECRLPARAETFVKRGRKDRSRDGLVDCSLDRPASFPRVGDPARKVIERGILGQRSSGEVKQP